MLLIFLTNCRMIEVGLECRAEDNVKMMAAELFYHLKSHLVLKNYVSYATIPYS